MPPGYLPVYMPNYLLVLKIFKDLVLVYNHDSQKWKGKRTRQSERERERENHRFFHENIPPKTSCTLRVFKIIIAVLCFWNFQWNWNQMVLWFSNIYKKKKGNQWFLRNSKNHTHADPNWFFGFFYNRIASPRVHIPGSYPLALSSEKWEGRYLC